MVGEAMTGRCRLGACGEPVDLLESIVGTIDGGPRGWSTRGSVAVGRFPTSVMLENGTRSADVLTM